MEDRPIVFTVTQITRNFGGLYSIKTKDSRANSCTYTDVSVVQLFDIMSVISEDFNNDGYAVLFEVD